MGLKDKAWQYLPAFDVYVCSSLKEGLPYSVLEALKSGLPVISTDVGGIPEMIEDELTGLLIKPADPQALAQGILELLDDKKLIDRITGKAKQTIEQKFSLAKMISETEKIYQS